ncbi:serrate RNA effector molecule homolog isoform X2 [Apostichopus japonicus]|uniref:serrate RNA effector molecule homolog isoform X2 n=1 Tax=Stichopus japonicus TaxID=307972 RepID=UPI003AB5AABE
MDSDDEYERGRRRDKFRRERSDYRDRRERDDRRRDNWADRRDGRENYRNDFNRRPYQNYSRGRSDNYRDQMSPPNKRPRRDWEPNYYNDRYGNQGYSQGGWNQSREKGPRRAEKDSTQLLSFKQFLTTQEDNIDDQEAVKKYNEYKLEFKKGQLSDFFLAHKDEEWFKMKYHPSERERENYKKLVRQRQRLHIFMEIFNKEILARGGLDASSAPDLMKIMDTIVIKLEGGTDFDLEVLEEIPDSEDKSDKEEDEEEKKEKPAEKKIKPPEPKPEEDGSKSDSKEEGEADDEDEKRPETEEGEDKKEDLVNSKPVQEKEQEKRSEPAKPPEPAELPAEEDKKKQRKKKRKEREYSYSSDDSSSSGSESDSESDPEPAPPGLDSEGNKSSKPALEPPKPAEGSADGKKVEEDKPPKPEELDEEPKPRALHKTFSLFFRNIAPVLTKKEIVDVCKRYKGYLRVALADPSPERAWNRHGWVTFDRSVNIKEICWNLSNIRLKDCELSPVVNRDLTHRIRAVSGITAHKTIVKSDLKLAARLIQLLDEESKVWDKSVMPTNPDVEPEPPAPPKEEEKKEEKKPEESEDAPNPPEEPPPAPPLPAKPAEPQNEVELLPPPTYERNPVLENITEFLVDETSAEEQLLLGSDLEEREEGQEDSNEIQFERDPAGSKVLDRLLCYLRFVHSVDYYSCSKFHIEDDMPSRCGLMHVRGANPPNRLTQKDMDTWKTNFERKISPLMSKKAAVSQDELSKLGRKDQEAEVEKFITANTQELAKDKWLCPLSGKKFKGPEFVRKHIFNKHSEKIDAVRKEVEYFNNYLGDVDRPQPPDPTPVTAQPPAQQNQGGGGPGGGGYNQQQGNFGNNHGPGNQQPPQQSPQGGNNFNRGGGGAGGGGNFNQQGGNFGGNNYQQQQQQQHQPQPPLRSNYDPYGYTPPSYSRQGGSRRPIIQYRDLDAPDSSDFF